MPTNKSRKQRANSIIEKRRKKADVEIQFNWIFVLIAGALILTLFVSIAVKQKNIARDRLVAEVIDKLTTILAGAQTTEGSAGYISVPDLSYTFKCELDTCNGYACASHLSTEGTKTGMSYAINPIFSPDLIRGNLMGTWTQDWNMPFGVTNFLYITAPNVRYVIVSPGDSSVYAKLAEEVYTTMPETITDQTIQKEIKIITKELVTSNQEIKPKAYYKTKIVNFASSLPLAADKFKNTELVVIDVTLITGGPGGIIDGYGELIFREYKKSRPSELKKSYYFTKPGLFAAIFAEDYENYECNMKKAMYRLRIVSEVYEKRTQKISEFLSQPGHTNDCIIPNKYPQAQQSFAAIKAAIKDYEDPNNREVAINKILIAQSELVDYNNKLMGASCPLIY